MSGRDMRDPEALGTHYLAARRGGIPVETAVLLPSAHYRSDETCIDRYGRPDDVTPAWKEIQVR